MLEAVGFPVAVNPEAKLAAIARRRGWHVEHWAKSRRRRPAAAAARPLDRPASLRRGRRVSQAALAGARRRRPDAARTGPMKALVFERNLPRFAAARVASDWLGPRRRRRARCGSSTSTRPSCPGDDWYRLRPLPVRHLRLRPGHLRRPQLALLRAHRQLPLRPRPRDRRANSTRAASTTPAGRWSRHPGGPRARARLRPRPSSPLPGLRRGPDRAVRQRRLRPPRARAPDRLLRRHRRWVVDGRAGRPRHPAPRRPGRASATRTR